MPSTHQSRAFVWLGLGLAAGVLVLFRLHAFAAPLETDECNYAYIGGRLLAGDRLYVDVWDHQPPGVFVLFAGVIALFGDEEAVFRLLATGFSLASMGLVFWIVSRRIGDAPAVFASVVFALVSSDPGTAGDGCNREIYMNTLTLGALAALTGTPIATNGRLLVAGLLLGIASTLKTVVAPIWGALLIWALYNRRHQQRTRTRPHLGGSTEYENGVSHGASSAPTGAGVPAERNHGLRDAAHRSTRGYNPPPRRGGKIGGARISAKHSFPDGGKGKDVAARATNLTGIEHRQDARATDADGIGRRIRQQWLPDAVCVALCLAAGPALIWLGIGCYFAATDRWDAFVDAVFRFNVGYAGADTGFHRRIAEFFDPIFPVFESARPLWLATIAVLVVLARSVRKNPAGVECGWVCFLLGSFLAVVLPGRFWPHYYYLMIPPMVVGCGIAWGRFRRDAPAAWVVGFAWMAAVATFQYRYYLGVDVTQFAAGRYDYRDQWARAQGRRVGEVTEPDDTVFIWGKDAGIYYYSDRRCTSRYTMIGALERRAVGFEARREVLLDELERHRPRLMMFVEPDFEFLMPLLDTFYVPAGIDRDDREPDKPILLVWALRDRPVRAVPWEWTAPRKGE